ncbi:hypothetical protein EKD04_016765 [Chloroflexales bacterium ZM16-3]|nr:hypothetical protein [Chloroflexales bacterium ZM16-3]
MRPSHGSAPASSPGATAGTRADGVGELLGALGLAWPRLLIYPGGMFALGLAWLLARWMVMGKRSSPPAPLPLRREREVVIIDALPPLLALALLPLPPARGFPYGIDLVAALALLGWPRLRALAAGSGLASGVLPGYGLLLLGGALMGAGAGGVELSRLGRAPDTALGWALLLGGGGLWLAGQARLYDGDRGWARRLGELGHLWVGTLPILAALAAGAADRLPTGWAGWTLPPLALIMAALALGAALRVS